MKKLILISALLLVTSNGWVDENKSFDQNNFVEAWNRVGEIEGAFAWFNQAIQRRVGVDDSPIRYNPSERIIIFLPNEDDLEACNFKKAKKVDNKAYNKQKNDFLNISYIEPANKNYQYPSKEKRIFPAENRFSLVESLKFSTGHSRIQRGKKTF